MYRQDNEFHFPGDEKPSLDHISARPTQMNLEIGAVSEFGTAGEAVTEEDHKLHRLLKRMFAVAGIAVYILTVNWGTGLTLPSGTITPPVPAPGTSSSPGGAPAPSESSAETSSESSAESSAVSVPATTTTYQMSAYLSSTSQQMSDNGIATIKQVYEYNNFDIIGNAQGFNPDDFETAEEALDWLKAHGASSVKQVENFSTVQNGMNQTDDTIVIGDPDDIFNAYIPQGAITIRNITRNYTTWEIVMPDTPPEEVSETAKPAEESKPEDGTKEYVIVFRAAENAQRQDDGSLEILRTMYHTTFKVKGNADGFNPDEYENEFTAYYWFESHGAVVSNRKQVDQKETGETVTDPSVIQEFGFTDVTSAHIKTVTNYYTVEVAMPAS